MKIAIFLLLALSAAAQTNVVYTWTVKASPADTAVNINVTQDAATAGANYLFAGQAGASPTTLTSEVSAGATDFPLASVTGIVVGNGICISSSALTCAITMSTGLSLSTGEIALVTSVVGNNVMVSRGSIGTAAAYSSGQAVTVVRSGSYSVMAAINPRRRDGQRNPGTRRAQQKSFQWRNRLSSTAHSYWDELAADRQQQRRREDRERHGEIAFRFPIFWTCWRSQCRLAYHKS
jgi:hypothetical protein